MTSSKISIVLIAVSCTLLFSQTQANILNPNSAERNEESNSNSNERDISFWREIKDSTFPEDFEAYLDQFPNGIFVSLAEIRLKKLRKTEAETPLETSPEGLQPSARRNIWIGETFQVPEWLRATRGHVTCGLKKGGIVTILAFQEDKVFVEYIFRSNAIRSRTDCLSGSLVFINASDLNAMISAKYSE